MHEDEVALAEQNMKISINDFLKKCDQICRKLRIWSHSLKNSVMKSFFFVQGLLGLLSSPRSKNKNIKLYSKKCNFLAPILKKLLYFFKKKFFLHFRKWTSLAPRLKVSYIFLTKFFLMLQEMELSSPKL